SLNIPIRVVENSIGTLSTTPLTLSKPNVMVSCLKKAEDSDDLVLRLYESFGESTDCAVKFGFTVKSAIECDLMENQLKQMKVSKGKLVLKFKPFEIKTLKLVFRKK
ncbi:MAG: alpha-mannosidase, partial [Bacteroidetes bacterium]|nr:alpha-mannosidase [Bacteroidota bacterium]